MATNAIKLAGSAASKMLLPVAKEPAAVSSFAQEGIYCIQQFFTNPGNKLAKFVGAIKSLDKCFKLSKAVSDCVVGSLEEAGCTGDALTSARNAQGMLKTTREVVALANVLNGAVPSIVNSTQRCYQYTRQAFELGSKTKERKTPGEYSKMLLTRGDYLLAASREACTAVGATTYSATFGVLRPLMLINKLTAKPFLDKATVGNFGTAVAGIMTINHMAGVAGAVGGIALEQKLFKRAKESLYNERCALENQQSQLSGDVILSAERALRKEHVATLKRNVLTLLEKALELVVDGVKLIPLPITVACSAAISGALTAASAGIGLYSIWQKTKSGK